MIEFRKLAAKIPAATKAMTAESEEGAAPIEAIEEI